MTERIMAIDNDVYQQLLEIFHGELVENHEKLTGGLLDIAKLSDSELVDCLSNLFRCSHNIKGAAKSVSLDDIATIAHQLEDKFSEWRDAGHRPTDEETNLCLNLVDTMLESFNKLTNKKSTTNEIIRIPLERVENANVKVDDFITYQLRFNNWISRLKTKLSTHAHIQSEFRTLLDESSSIANEFSRALSSLQTDMREMRLLPFKSILSPLERSAHDLSKSFNKPLNLIIKGDDTELDKAILDLLKDPLQHLLRNSIDHGIDDADSREAQHKDPTATISITVTQDEGKIKIIFKDDGKGIDVNLVKQKALANNIIHKSMLDKLSKSKILNLLTYPGFSTRDEVTEISGRGVGLDVVADNLRKAKGSLEIDSELGKGTTFTLIVPLTLAVTRGVFTKCANRNFMLPSLSIDSVYDIKCSDIKSVAADSVVIIEGKTLPVRFLSSLLALNMTDAMQETYSGIVLGDDEGHQVVILVDSIEDEYDCVIKPMPHPFNQINLYMGLTLIGSGELIPVLDVKILYRLAKSFDHSQIDTLLTTTIHEQAKHILVVDDSLTTRGLAANALSSAGFEVDTAVNGDIAWNKIKNGHYDCIVTDIEMPVLNGFELTKRVKSSTAHQHIPVIIVSSRESSEDQQQGTKVGANAYLIKSQFSTRELIKTIEALL